MARAYYNEIDPFAAQWLRNLIARGLIPAGEVDERSIVDVRGDDIRGFCQWHFFCGIGGWPYALRLAGWPDDRPVATGSCPCQPLSVAGQQRGHADERHLWPAFHRIIAERKFPVVFGEQVASKIGREWLAGVRADLESDGYACGAANLCAASVGAPHIRERLFWVAYANDLGGQYRSYTGAMGTKERRGKEEKHKIGGVGKTIGDSRDGLGDAEGLRRGGRQDGQDAGRRERALADTGARGASLADPDDVDGDGRRDERSGRRPEFTECGGMGDAISARLEGRLGARYVELQGRTQPNGSSGTPSPFVRELADADSERQPQRAQFDGEQEAGREAVSARGYAGRRDGLGFWSDAEWRVGADGKTRRVGAGLRLLADGVPARVGRLRGYGNAIVPQVAQAFIEAVMEARP